MKIKTQAGTVDALTGQIEGALSSVSTGLASVQQQM